MTRYTRRARDNHPGERHGDARGEDPVWWRDLYLWLRAYILPATFWSFMASLIAVWALVLHYGDQQKITEGRTAAIAITCGGLNGVILAGRQIVLGSTDPHAPVTPFERQLEALGYPPRKVRRAQAMAAANLYAQQIGQSVRAEADGNARDIVAANGTFNCRTFERVAHAR